MLNLISKSRDRMYTAFLWEEYLNYPIYIQSIGFYHATVGLSHGEVHGGEFETSMHCSNCKEVYEWRAWADNEVEAVSQTMKDAKEDGWTDGPLCPKCSKKKAS